MIDLDMMDYILGLESDIRGIDSLYVYPDQIQLICMPCRIAGYADNSRRRPLQDLRIWISYSFGYGFTVAGYRIYGYADSFTDSVRQLVYRIDYVSLR